MFVSFIIEVLLLFPMPFFSVSRVKHISPHPKKISLSRVTALRRENVRLWETQSQMTMLILDYRVGPKIPDTVRTVQISTATSSMRLRL